jgi:hypothetical protein
MRRDIPTAPNWSQVIAQILATGLPRVTIWKELGISERALACLERDVQPLFYRGEKLVALWCASTGKARAEIPLTEVVRGHRRARQAVDQSPKAIDLRALAPLLSPLQRVAMQGKKRRKKEPA